jgi:hypothetical protein
MERWMSLATADPTAAIGRVSEATLSFELVRLNKPAAPEISTFKSLQLE